MSPATKAPGTDVAPFVTVTTRSCAAAVTAPSSSVRAVTAPLPVRFMKTPRNDIDGVNTFTLCEAGVRPIPNRPFRGCLDGQIVKRCRTDVSVVAPRGQSGGSVADARTHGCGAPPAGRGPVRRMCPACQDGEPRKGPAPKSCGHRGSPTRGRLGSGGEADVRAARCVGGDPADGPAMRPREEAG